MNYLPHLATAPTVQGGQPDLFQPIIDAVQHNPLPLALTVVILLVAAVIGRFLSHIVSRAPVRSDKNGGNGGRLAGRVRDELTSSGRLLARVTGISIWLAALIA